MTIILVMNAKGFHHIAKDENVIQDHGNCHSYPFIALFAPCDGANKASQLLLMLFGAREREKKLEVRRGLLNVTLSRRE